MILEGNERGYGGQLAQHLLNPTDNDHVTVHAINGFVADDLHGAFAEAEAISQATQCQKYLFSLSLNPPPDKIVPVDVFEEAIAKVERKLGLTGQPRAVVFHEKNGRRHAHCVWSRIDATRLRAVNLSLYKRKLTELSRELYLTYDWDMPAGFKDATDRDPLNHSRQEAGQAKRLKRDPKVQKAMFRTCWEHSDSRAGFEAALKEQGYVLARGNRRGFVAVDAKGKVWSLSRWCGVKATDLRLRLGPEDTHRSVDEVAADLSALPKPDVQPENAVFEARRAKLVTTQRAARAELITAQDARRVGAVKDRQRRLPTGLRAVLARVTGQYASILQGFETETDAALARDRLEQQTLISTHLAERRALTRDAQQHGVSDAFGLQSDPRQRLALPRDDIPFTKQQLTANPDLILEYISHKQAEFDRTDVLRALAKRIDDLSALQSAAGIALRSPELVLIGKENGKSRYTMRDYAAAHDRLTATASVMAASGGFSVDPDHTARAIKRQNAQMKHAFGGSLSAEQRAALAHVLGEQQLSCVVGLAGAGKSTLLATAREAWEDQGICVHGAALAGKAAEGLETASGIASRTLASLETAWKHGYDPIAQGDVLVVDEAGMLGTRQVARVAAKLDEIGAKLVLVGDPDQLQPIEAGTPFRHLTTQHGAAQLKEIHRQREDWQKLASKELAEGSVDAAVNRYRDRSMVTQTPDRDAAIEALVESYAMDVAANGAAVSRLALAHKRKDVYALNQAIRAELRSDPDAAPETLFSTETGDRAFAQNDRIVLTRNDKEIGVKNGMLGMVVSASETEIAVELDGETPRRVQFDPRAFQSFDHGYAVTVHKSQGATVDQAYVLASRSMDRHLAYVAMTRHREDMRLFVNEKDRLGWTKPQPQLNPQHFKRDGPSRG